MIRHGSSRLCCVVPIVLGGDFRSPLLVVFLVCFRDLAHGDLMGKICGNPSWFFFLWFPSQIRELRGSILGFRCSSVTGVLGGISSIPLDLASFGGHKLVYGLPMRCPYYPQILAQVRGMIREIEVWILGCWPAGVVHPEKPRSHRSDWCLSPVWPVQPSLGFCSGERLGVFAVVPYCCCFKFSSVWSSVGLFGVLGLSSRDRSDRWCSPAWPV
jgi:hypothetical protein